MYLSGMYSSRMYSSITHTNTHKQTQAFCVIALVLCAYVPVSLSSFVVRGHTHTQHTHRLAGLSALVPALWMQIFCCPFIEFALNCRYPLACEVYNISRSQSGLFRKKYGKLRSEYESWCPWIECVGRGSILGAVCEICKHFMNSFLYITEAIEYGPSYAGRSQRASKNKKRKNKKRTRRFR